MPTDMPPPAKRRPTKNILDGATSTLSRLFQRPATSVRSEIDPAEDACLRCEVVQDMLCANPAAFQSEQDVQAMLHGVPGRV